MHSGSFIDIYQIQRSFDPHVNFCLEVLRNFLVTVFGQGIHKLQNSEDEKSLLLVSLHLDRLSFRPERYKCKYGRISHEFRWSTLRLDHRGPAERRSRSEPNSLFYGFPVMMTVYN